MLRRAIWLVLVVFSVSSCLLSNRISTKSLSSNHGDENQIPGRGKLSQSSVGLVLLSVQSTTSDLQHTSNIHDLFATSPILANECSISSSKTVGTPVSSKSVGHTVKQERGGHGLVVLTVGILVTETTATTTTVYATASSLSQIVYSQSILPPGKNSTGTARSTVVGTSILETQSTSTSPIISYHFSASYASSVTIDSISVTGSVAPPALSLSQTITDTIKSAVSSDISPANGMTPFSIVFSSAGSLDGTRISNTSVLLLGHSTLESMTASLRTVTFASSTTAIILGTSANSVGTTSNRILGSLSTSFSLNQSLDSQSTLTPLGISVPTSFTPPGSSSVLPAFTPLGNSSTQTSSSTKNGTLATFSAPSSQPPWQSVPSSSVQIPHPSFSQSSAMTFTRTISSTTTLNDTSSVTVVIITFVTTLSGPTTFSTKTASFSTFSSSTDSTFSDSFSISDSNPQILPTRGTETIMSTTPDRSVPSSVPVLTISQVPGTIIRTCDNDLPPWCAYPTTFVPDAPRLSTLTILSSSFCACPTCLMASPLCVLSPPQQTTSCPLGWLCSLTIPYPTSTAYWSIAPGLDWQTDLPEWSEHSETLTNTKTKSITSMSWTASLSTSTHDGRDGSLTLFPLRVWNCVGSLCDPDRGVNWLDRVKCLLTIGCHSLSNGILGFPPPPPPVLPPIAPPELDYQTKPTTMRRTDNPSNSESSTASSTGWSTASSTSSCSASQLTSCTQICSSVLLTPSGLSETCSQSCRTTTACSGRGVDTTLTAPCTQTVVLESLQCTNITVSGLPTTTCVTQTTITTGCQDSTTTSFAACGLNQPLDPNIMKTLQSWAAQYPFNPAALTLFPTPQPASPLASLTVTSTTAALTSSSSEFASMSAAMSASSAASVSLQSESSRSASISSVSSLASVISVVNSQLSVGSSILSEHSVSSSRGAESSRTASAALEPSIPSQSSVATSSIPEASVASELSPSASSSESVSSASQQSDTEASALASQIAFSTRSQISVKPSREGVTCAADDAGRKEYSRWPKDDDYQWIEIGVGELPHVIQEFCSWIGSSKTLGHSYYVYSGAEWGHSIGTQYGANITLSVTWDADQCDQLKSNSDEKPCPNKDRSKGPWWQCAVPEDGQVTFDTWGLDTRIINDDAFNFCVASFAKIGYHCSPTELGVKGSWTIGGYASTRCLRWSMVASKISPTFYWPLGGNGTSDMRWLAEIV